AEAAALFLLRRENAPDPLPGEVVELSGPEVLTGESVAAIWSEVLGRPVAYAGDDLAAFEQQSRAQMPGWLAYDTALMFRGFQRSGMLPGPGAVAELTRLLGHPPRSYRSFAEEMAAQWRDK
ncbi:MAG: NmrA/HSCARG family protein, partial [Hymenobacter sp.]|nr:NmrA/HSCARG family protein [Hymenobacter sp.]